MTRRARGKLIVLEGVDGAGKSTQFQLLRVYLEGSGLQVVAGREPTDGEWGRRVRAAAAAGKRLPVDVEVDYLLKDRQEHVQRVILPALESGSWVLLDRYYPSMMAYQGAAGIDPDDIRRRNEKFAPAPDLALWLDIPTEVALQRVAARGQSVDAFEQGEFLRTVAQAYAGMSMPWWHRLSADASTQVVHERIREALRLVLGFTPAPYRQLLLPLP